MPNTDYPLATGYTQKSITRMSKTQISQYVFDSIYQLKWTDRHDEITCLAVGGMIVRIKIYNVNNQRIAEDITICGDLEYNNLPDSVVIRQDGFIYITKYRSLGIWGNVKNLITAAVRSLEVFTGIALVFDIKPMLNELSNLGKTLKLPASKIGSLVSKTVDLYQKASSRIDKVLHVNLLKKFHTLGRVISPEYNTYWKAQESTLADLSSKVFGDFSTLASYVHLTEVIYMIQIANARRDKDQKRLDMLEHGAKVTELIKGRIRSYERNPLNLWGDILYYTFEEGNKYIDMHGVEVGAEILEFMSKTISSVKYIDKKLRDLRLYDVALKETNLFTMSKGITDITTLFNDTYNNVLKPTFRVIEKIYNEQQKAIAELEKRKLDRLKIEQRGDILNADPDSLSGYDKILQDNQFIKTFNSAIEGVPEGFTFETHDIKEFIEDESER